MNKDWLIQKEDVFIHYHQCIGCGEFGNIYIATWKKTKVVAKVFSKMNDEKRELMQREIQIMTKLHHPNIIQMYGYMMDPLTIIMEYIEGLNLSENRIFSRFIFFDRFRKKVHICQQISHGLLYLHQRKPSFIIHRDLKPSNILISHQQKVKIIDFGISKLLYELNETPYFTQNVGTYIYMAPEIYQSNHYTYKVDIYSMGIIMYEIFEECRFYIEGISNLQEFKKKIEEQERASWKKYGPWFYKTPSKIRRLVETCWKTDPNDRPTTMELVNALDSI